MSVIFGAGAQIRRNQPLADTTANDALPVQIQAVPGQTGDLLQFLDAAGSVLSAVDIRGTGGLLRVASVTLTAPQIKNLVAAPVQLVPAPGPGLLLNMVSLVAHFTPGSEVLADGGNTALAYTDYSGRLSQNVSFAVLQGTDEVVAPLTFDNQQFFAVADAANRPFLWVINGATDFTGNASNDATLTVTAYYTILEA